jgi:hypothetical protein
LVSARIIIFCPLILVAIFLFRDSTYQILTLLTPFAFVEFLHIKYDKVFLAQQYYLIFLILSLLCILYKAQTIKNQNILKLVVGVLAAIQLFTGYSFLQNSPIREERTFSTVLFNRAADSEQDQNRDLANYLNHLPQDSHVLVDDAIAYPVVAFTNNVRKLTLPYQGVFLTAIEAPDKYDDYILLATANNQVTGFTQLNDKYVPVIKKANSALNLRRVFETDDWILYKIFDN